MADMLQMTYSEMENLVKALKTSSDDLENLSSQIMSLISEIQDAVGIKWLKTIVSHTDILNNTIYYLNDISSTTSETWQGDRYENFSGKILPSIINASEIITNKEDEFKEGLKAEIKPILEDLQKIAEDFKKQGAECGAQSIWIAQYIKEHQGVEAQSGPVVGEERKKIEEEMNSKSDVSIVPDRELTDEEKAKIREYNDLYEKLHGDEKEKIDKFFENSNGFSEEDIENIKYIAYRSKGNAHDVFFKYIDQIKAEYSITDEGGAYYTSDENMVYIHQNLKNNEMGSYNTFFHEVGHNIDNLALNGADGNFYTTEMNNGSLYNTIREDIKEDVKGYIEKYNNDTWIKIDDKGKEKILNALIDGGSGNLNPRLRVAYDDIRNNIKDSLNGASNAEISDAFGGVTENRLKSGWGHTTSFTDLLNNYFNEDTDELTYWTKKDGTPTGKQNKDIFAAYFANEMTGDADAEKAREYLQRTYSALDDAMAKIAGK